MVTLTPLLDTELAASRWLRADPEVVGLVEDRVYTELPGGKEFPMLRVFRVGGAPDTWPYHLDRADLQIDAWGGSKRQASDLIRAAMAALVKLTLPGAWKSQSPEQRAVGVLARVTFSGLVYLPDVDVPAKDGRARPRYLVTATAVAHSPP